MKQRIPRRRSISIRLTLATVLISLLVSVAVTAAGLVVSYHRHVHTATQRLDEVGKTIVPSLSASLWLIDPDRVNLLMDALLHMPGIAYARLDSEGSRIVRGSPAATPLLRRRFVLSYDQGGHYPLGTLAIEVDRQPVIARLWRESVSIASTTLAALLAASLALLLLFRLWVTRHLEAMARYAREMTIGRLAEPLVLRRRSRRGRPDELEQVVFAFNQMRERMLDELHARTHQEQELAAHRERLECLVRERTFELEQQTRELVRQKLEVQRLADTDTLTGVSSRRRFLEQLEHELSRSRRNGQPLSVLMLDIDHFKRINDSHGHAAGDQTLAAVSEACRRQMRGEETIGRLGGEEFSVLLPGTDARQARAVAERLRAAVAETGVELPDGAPIRCTVSIGVSELADKQESADALLARADRALYRVKRAGRNRVQVAPSGEPGNTDES